MAEAVEVMTVPLLELGEDEEGLRGPFSVTCPSLLLGGVSTFSVNGKNNMARQKTSEITIQPDNRAQEARLDKPIGILSNCSINEKIACAIVTDSNLSNHVSPFTS